MTVSFFLRYAAVIPSCFAALLLRTSTAMGQRPTSVYATAPVPPLRFHQEGNRLLATVDGRLLETDFTLRAQVTATTGPATATAEEEGQLSSTVAPVPLVGAQLTSGALRLRRTGDSLVVLEYGGSVHGRFQYRRRATTPILYATPAGSWLIDGAPLWRTIEPRTPGAAAVAVLPATAFEPASTGRPQLPHTVSPSFETTTAVQRVSGYTINYRIDVQLLPKEAMRPRLRDWRIRFLPGSVGQEGNYIWRWRLEKKDSTVPVSDVVQPIIVQIEKNVPPEWIPYIRRGVEEWTPVFESIGFRHAIVIRSPIDTSSNDRVIHFQRWPTGPNAHTEHNVDPRTGEILGATVELSDTILLAAARLFGLVGRIPLHAGAPVPDSMRLAVLPVFVAHEIGHALGLDHNFKGSTTHPTDSLRRPNFLHRVGLATSVMGYANFNAIARPEDPIPLEDLLAHVSAYDRWAINWGYRPIPNAPTPDAELPTLERWLAAQDTAPYLRPGMDIDLDPNEGAGSLGDDRIKTASYTIHNLAHAAAAFDPQRDTGPADAAAGLSGPDPFPLYANSTDLWTSAILRALKLVGGLIPQAPYPINRDSLSLLPVDSAQQIEAIRFVFAHTFYGQDELIGERVLAHLPQGKGGTPSLVLFDTVAPGWTVERWQKTQQGLLDKLTDPNLMERVPVGVLPALCQELKALNQRLSTAAADGSVPARQRQAQALDAVLVASLSSDPKNAGSCPR